MTEHEDEEMLRYLGLYYLAELDRSEAAPFNAAGGPAPRVWHEVDGAPVRTRNGMLRVYGRVQRIPGAE